jgi:hypothetical protein
MPADVTSSSIGSYSSSSSSSSNVFDSGSMGGGSGLGASIGFPDWRIFQEGF